jgi:hypothetical protein
VIKLDNYEDFMNKNQNSRPEDIFLLDTIR